MMGWVSVKMYNNLVKELRKTESELAKYKSKTPYTADGVPIFIGSIVFAKDQNGEGKVFSINENYLAFSNQYKCSKITDCYSTRAALEAAMALNYTPEFTDEQMRIIDESMKGGAE